MYFVFISYVLYFINPKVDVAFNDLLLFINAGRVETIWIGLGCLED